MSLSGRRRSPGCRSVALMPELPEVETVVRGLRAFLPGRMILATEVLHPKPLGGVAEEVFCGWLAGKTFEGVSRFGKFIRMEFRGGGSLVAHLRMTGKFIRLDAASQPLPPHARVVWRLENGTRLVFQDMRLFGTLRYYPPGAEIAEKARVGIDALDPALDAERLLRLTAGRRTPLKLFLLQQEKISGLGNIYVCEALFRARLSPLRPCGSLSRDEADRLLQAIRRTLLLALELNGTTISDFRSVDDKTGGFQQMLQVYGREGEACRVCSRPVERLRQGQRSTYWCPACQQHSDILK